MPDHSYSPYDAKKKRDEFLAGRYNQKIIARIGNPVRFFFFAMIGISLISFFYCPFKKTDTVSEAGYYEFSIKNSESHVAELETSSGRTLKLNSTKLKDVKFHKGDTILVLKNFLYQSEGVYYPKTQETYYLQKKWVWYFVWFFALTAAIASLGFRSLQDLRIKSRMTIGLIVLMLLYFIL